eukprot:TRINITY_DN6365_c1_g2_i2.p1 TRINITY_DN6365_c1_g2~~TRINITY_DN6365_c1_g2_i2.p1  ORF type:complete len:599 (+),score=219.75 TRINITY_DN6365_c1_g2_i2:67-1797(+)
MDADGDNACFDYAGEGGWQVDEEEEESGDDAPASPVTPAPASPLSQATTTAPPSPHGPVEVVRLERGTGEPVGLEFARRKDGPLFCTRTRSGSPARRAGVPDGAILTSISGIGVVDGNDLAGAVREAEASGLPLDVGFVRLENAKGSPHWCSEQEDLNRRLATRLQEAERAAEEHAARAAELQQAVAAAVQGGGSGQAWLWRALAVCELREAEGRSALLHDSAAVRAGIAVACFSAAARSRPPGTKRVQLAMPEEVPPQKAQKKAADAERELKKLRAKLKEQAGKAEAAADKEKSAKEQLESLQTQRRDSVASSAQTAFALQQQLALKDREIAELKVRLEQAQSAILSSLEREAGGAVPADTDGTHPPGGGSESPPEVFEVLDVESAAAKTQALCAVAAFAGAALASSQRLPPAIEQLMCPPPCRPPLTAPRRIPPPPAPARHLRTTPLAPPAPWVSSPPASAPVSARTHNTSAPAFTPRQSPEAVAERLLAAAAQLGARVREDRDVHDQSRRPTAPRPCETPVARGGSHLSAPTPDPLMKTCGSYESQQQAPQNLLSAVLTAAADARQRSWPVAT